jgi:hypothetical protein
MSQAPLIDASQYPQIITIKDGSGAFVEQYVGAALLALATQNSGPTEPSPTYALMIWADTSENKLKIRNTSNNGWISYLDLATGNLLTSAATATNVKSLPGYVNLIGKTTSVTVSVAADYGVLQNSSANVIALTGISLNKTVNIGATSTDTGATTAANTWYKVWHIYNPSADTQLLTVSSVTSTSPTLPSGYTHYKYVMCIRGTVGGLLYHTIKNDKEQAYIIEDGVLSQYREIASGVEATLTAKDISDYIPPTGVKIKVIAQKVGGAGVQIELGSNGSHYLYYNNGVTAEAALVEFTLESTDIYYQSNNASNYCYCYGWTE